MSTGAESILSSSGSAMARRRVVAGVSFLVLLLLSLLWPSPVLSINALCCHAAMPIDDLSFLGREAPSWDVVFWCVAGLLAIALLEPSPDGQPHSFGHAWRLARKTRPIFTRIDGAGCVAGVIAVALTWRFLDAPTTAFAEWVQTHWLQDGIRILNRLSGGMNPALIVVFFLLAGTVYRHERWVRYAVSMGLGGAAAGLIVQVVKVVVSRTRPELWLGPFQHARIGANSFPSGHTVAAFAIGGVLIASSPSRMVRSGVLLLAIAIGASRILAFRHWTSDVLASAAIGFLAAVIASRAVSAVTDERSDGG